MECIVQCRVPGLALNQPPHIWLTANELLRFSSDQRQEEFYRVAGIQTAVFIHCGNGVVEIGTTNLVQADEQNKLRIRSLLASVIASTNVSVPMPMPGSSISTSSRSSLLSRSIDSPGSSSIVSYLQYPTKSPDNLDNIPQVTRQYSTSASELAIGSYPYQQMLQLPSSSGLLISGHDYDYETRVGYPRSSQQINVPDLLLFPQTSQASDFPVAPSARSIILSAFGMWRPPSKVLTPPLLQGQYRMKRCLAIMRNIYAEKVGQASIYASYKPPGGTISSAQVHHMISERRRRDKLKESFDALRTCIPSGTRKDKASILSYTREYLISLKSRVEGLEERNMQLESELKNLPLPQSRKGAGTSTTLQQQGSTCTEGGDNEVTVEISKMGGSSDEMGIVVVVDRPTNTIELMIALLKCLRGMGVPLISTGTTTAHHEHDPSRLQFRMTATIRLQDQEVEQVKEQLMRAVGKGSGPPPS